MEEQTLQAQKQYPRFTPTERFEHILLIVTFVGLSLTGLPQKYAAEDWAKTMINLMGGVESIRIVHRILATILMAESIYHGGIITYKLYVLGRRASMLPGIRDLRDVIQWITFNLGWSRSHPHLPRYNFGEKAEYLAVVWGTVVMIITGFMMWNPITTSTVLPGEVIPAARVAHGNEALLAVLSILIWHMYNVHVRRFNRSMFTGKLSREAMIEEHAAELETIEKGELPPGRPPQVIERRKRRFWPYAIIMTIILVGGLIRFLTVEQTAITTIPRQLSVVGGPLLVSADNGQADQGATLWQTLECKTCHGENAESGDMTMNVILAGTKISFEAFVGAVRRGPADMHPFSADQITDEQLAHLYAWLRTLER